MQIRDFTEQEQDGRRYYTARVVVDGDSVPVTREFGSWLIPLGDGRYREVLPDVAAALEQKLPAAARRAAEPVKLSKDPADWR